MGDVDWGDEDDNFLSTVDWDAQEALAKSRYQSNNAHYNNQSIHGTLQQQQHPLYQTHQQQQIHHHTYHNHQPPPPQKNVDTNSTAFHSDVRSFFHGGHAPPNPTPQLPTLSTINQPPQYTNAINNTLNNPVANPLSPPPPPPVHPPPQITLYASLELRRSTNSPSSIPAHGSPTQPMFEVRMGWHDAAAASLRRLGGGTWEPSKRIWIFPISYHDKVVEALSGVSAVKVRVEPLHAVPNTVLKAVSSIPDDSTRYCHVPSQVESQLMEFQREGIRFALRRGGRCLFGDEMGLGKTVQALALAAAYRDEWPGLIIAPSSLREQWADALHKWLGVTEERVHIVHSGKDAAMVPGSGIDFLIVSYNFLDKMDLAGRYQVVIVDESHYIKDNSAKRTKAAMPILKDAKRCLLLTGTPALNRPKEIFTQLSCLLPSAKLKMKDFGERYCRGNRFDKYGGSQNLDELHAMLRGSILVRRLKADVLTQLPKKRRQQVFLSLDSESRKELVGLQRQLDAVKTLLAQCVARQEASHGAAAGVGVGKLEESKAIMEMYRRTAELKAKSVQEYTETLLDGGQKFLIFAHHTSLMDAIEHTCNRKKGCKFIRMDGKTPPVDRSTLVKRFQEDNDVKVAILSIRAAGVGLTLTAASTVVFAEMTWTPGEIIQAEDRAHRIGQASSVNVYFLHVKNSVDDIIWNSIQNKLENVGQALDGEDKAMEVAAARTMPERGQKALDGYFIQQKKELHVRGEKVAWGADRGGRGMSNDFVDLVNDVDGGGGEVDVKARHEGEGMTDTGNNTIKSSSAAMEKHANPHSVGSFLPKAVAPVHQTNDNALHVHNGHHNHHYHHHNVGGARDEVKKRPYDAR